MFIMFYLVIQLVLTWLFMFQLPQIAVQAQQAYENNKQLDCNNHYNSTDGNICNGVSFTCLSYLTFRSSPPYYNSPTSIAYLLGSTPALIASANKISDVEIIPSNKQIIIPVNCSCGGPLLYYQHDSSYVLKFPVETYLTVANNTYQGLTTCQTLMSQNMYDARNLSVGDELKVPLRCACPTSNQAAAGFRYLLSYMVTWGDSISAIARMFGVDEKVILDANELSSEDLIFPFTPILVPLKQQPAKIVPLLSPTPPPPADSLPSLQSTKSSNKKWVIVVVAVGIAVVAIVFFLGFVLFCYCRSRSQTSEAKGNVMPISKSESVTNEVSAESKFDCRSQKDLSWSVPSERIHDAASSLTMYKFEDLERATEFFSEEKRIMGSSVYKAWLNGDAAAIKVIKGDVSSEINMLKRINHSNIIRLSGSCSHVKNGNTYLVFEFAENGSLDDWLHSKLDDSFPTLTWKQRVQIAYDIADALNYLHNYTNPPYIHKNLKSSNVLLDSNMRTKVSDFALARTLGSGDDFAEEEEGVRVQMTRHVIGTQGYIAPEYMENGVITPKLDVFALGVVMLELVSGKEAIYCVGEDNGGKKNQLLSAYVSEVLEGDNVREKLRSFVDPNLRGQYPLDLAFSMAQLARECVDSNLGHRPPMPKILVTMSKILSSSSDWDPSIDYATCDSYPDTR